MGHFDVRVRRTPQKGGPCFEIQVNGWVEATAQQTWAVLTDYARLPEFVPDLLSSRQLSRSGAQITLEQQGRAGFLFLRHAIHVVVQVTEHPFSALDVALLAGNMKHYASHWELAPMARGGGTRILYRGSLAPDFFVPALLGQVLVQRDVQNMLAAVAAEIERRAGLAR